MGRSAQIFNNMKSTLTEDELVKEFLEIIRPLGFDIKGESDNGIYMNPRGDFDKGVRVWVDQSDEPLDSINGEDYYETAEYMKKYPDAIFHCEANLMDKTDIDTLVSQPFQPSWFYLFKHHKFRKG